MDQLFEKLKSLTKENNECWEWQRSTTGGYGNIRYHGKTVGTHRLMMHIVNGFDLSDKRLVLHICNNRSCINPKHLYIGTHSDNNRDTVRSGKNPMSGRFGTKHPSCKYSIEQIQSVFEMIRQGLSHREIANQVGMTISYVSSLRNRRYRPDVSSSDDSSLSITATKSSHQG